MMRGAVRSACLFALLVPLVGGTAAGQDVTGNIQGIVLGPDREPIVGALISLTGLGIQGTRRVTTDASGQFRAVRLPVGLCTAHVRQIGYRELILEDVIVQLGRTTALGEIFLEAQPVELEPLVVSARGAVIDPTSTTTGANLTSDSYELLPVERDLESVIALLPQANVSYLGTLDPDPVNIGGATGLENVYYIEGINVTDVHRNIGGAELPYNFVREVQVKQGGYEAEHGRALGGIVNVLTQSGGDEFRVNAFGYFTNDALIATGLPGAYDLGQEGAADYDLGFSIGGPIVRSRLWFFSAYNPRVQTLDLQLPSVGVYQDRKTTHRFAGKLDWHAGEATDLTLSLFGDPTQHRKIGNWWVWPPPAALGNADPYLADWSVGTFNISLQARSQIGRRLLLEGTLGRSWRDEDQQGDTERGRTEPLVNDYTTGEVYGGFGFREDHDGARTSGQLAATLFLGRHTAKAGLAYEENRLDVLTNSFDPGIVFRYQDFDFVIQDNNDNTVRNRVPTAYLQDSWKVTNRLTLNAGLRWDGQYLIGTGDSVAQAITDQWQPRLGIVYQPGELGTQKIFGSAGRYYLQLPLFYSKLVHTIRDDCTAVTDQDSLDPEVELEFYCTPMPQGEKVEGLRGEHFDEFTLGYERALGADVKLSLRGVHRVLREAIGAGFLPEGGVTPAVDYEVAVGNIGQGELSFLPEPRREYSALEATVGGTAAGRRLRFLASYVLSRSYGNYTGQFISDQGQALPGINTMLEVIEQNVNSTGLMPNDRTHSLKLSGSYAFDFGLTAGTFFALQSGTPLSEFGASPIFFRWVFLVPRGTAGRTPTIWDLNLRLTYDVGHRARDGGRSVRLILDLLHVGNPQEVVNVDQARYLGVDGDGNQTDPSPTFGQPLVHQPPMTLRLGAEVSF